MLLSPLMLLLNAKIASRKAQPQGVQ